jgi:ankyrin repeat protein
MLAARVEKAADQSPMLNAILEQNVIDVNARNKDNETALMFAAEQCNLSSIQSLLKAGARLNIKKDESYTKDNGHTGHRHWTAYNNASDCSDEIKALLKTD